MTASSKPRPLETNCRISEKVASRPKETRDVEAKEQTARKGHIKEQSASKRLKILKQRSKPLKMG